MPCNRRTKNHVCQSNRENIRSRLSKAPRSLASLLLLTIDFLEPPLMWVLYKLIDCLSVSVPIQSLLVGLLYNRPPDPIDFMKHCLCVAKDLGNAPIRQTTFMVWDEVEGIHQLYQSKTKQPC